MGETGTGVRVIHLQTIDDSRGHLTVIESSEHIPFPIARVYFLHDVPAGSTRGGHAHRKLEQLLVAAAGSVEVVIYDGVTTRNITLNEPSMGLYIPPMHWRELQHFTSGAVLLVLASAPFEETDYIRDLEQFRSTLGVTP